MTGWPGGSPSPRRPLVLCLLAAAAGVGLWGLGEAHALFLAASRALEEVVRAAGGWAMGAFVLLAGLSALVAPFSSAAVVPAAVLAWGKLTVFLLLLAGWMLGGVGAYALGRYAAYPAVRRLLPWREIEAWRAHVPHGAGLLLAALVRLALPSEVGYAYGVLRYNFGKYLLVTALAELPVAALLVQASDALLARHLGLFLALVALGAAMVGVGVWLHAAHHTSGASPGPVPGPAGIERSPSR